MPIPINSATPEQLEDLHGIGPDLARRIVEYRQQHGPFRGPAELAEVPGVGESLALELSPHIDWTAPKSAAALRKRKWISDSINIASGMALLLWIPWQAFEKHHGTSFATIGDPASGVWVEAWTVLSLLLLGFCAALAFILLTVAHYLPDAPWPARLGRSVPICAGFFLSVGVSVGLANAAYYQFYSPSGWHALFKNQRAFEAIVTFVAYFLPLGPMLLVLAFPGWVRKRAVQRFVDTSLVLFSPVVAWWVWVNVNGLPLAALLLAGTGGVAVAVIAVRMIRSGQSVLQDLIDDLPGAESSDRQEALDKSPALVELRLPDPEEQRALQALPDSGYPPSRLRTAGNFVILGGGGWMIATVFGSLLVRLFLH